MPTEYPSEDKFRQLVRLKASETNAPLALSKLGPILNSHQFRHVNFHITHKLARLNRINSAQNVQTTALKPSKHKKFTPGTS